MIHSSSKGSIGLGYTAFPGLALAADSLVFPFCLSVEGYYRYFGVRYVNKVCFVVTQKWNLAPSKSWVPLEVCFLANSKQPLKSHQHKSKERKTKTPNTRNSHSVHILRTGNLNHLHKIEESIKGGVCAVLCVGALQLFFSVISPCHALSYPYEWHLVVKHWFELCRFFLDRSVGLRNTLMFVISWGKRGS